MGKKTPYNKTPFCIKVKIINYFMKENIGAPLKEIAEKYGVSIERVSAILTERLRK